MVVVNLLFSPDIHLYKTIFVVKNCNLLFMMGGPDITVFFLINPKY